MKQSDEGDPIVGALSTSVDEGEGGSGVWSYVPTLALMRGFSYAFVMLTSATFFKSIGVGNAVIGYISLFALPATLKFLWAPIADSFNTKRNWMLVAWSGFVATVGAMSLLLFLDPVPLSSIVVAFAVCAIVYGLSDFASDGFFVCAVNPSSRTTGIVLLTAFSRGSIALLSGVIFCAGFFGDRLGSVNRGWAAALGVLAIGAALLTAYNAFVLPRPQADQPARIQGGSVPWREIIRSYMESPKFWTVIAYLFTLRLGENLVMRMSQVFFVEVRGDGGLGLSLQEVSFVGAVSLVGMIGGGVLSMSIIRRFGNRRTMVPLTLVMLAPNTLYLLLALYPSPSGIDIVLLGSSVHISQVGIVSIVHFIEHFGYGLGYTFYFSVIVAMSHGRYRASHMSFGNAVSLLGVIIPNAIAGLVQEAVGWPGLFVFALLLCVPGFLLMLRLPSAVIDTDSKPR